LGIDPIYLVAEGVRHNVGKLSMRATTLFWIASQSKVCSQSYGVSKSQESQLVVRGKVIEYTIRGKVVASLKSGPW